MIVCLKVISLSARHNRASNANMQRIVNENITIDAVELLTAGTLEQMFVHIIIGSLTCETVRRLTLIDHLNEARDWEQMMVGSCQMRRKDERETANDALNWQLTVLGLTRRTIVALSRDLARIRCAQVTHANRQGRHVLLVRVRESMRKAHLDE